MNRIVRTFDPQIVKTVFLHPTVWQTIQDDEPLCPATWEPVFNSHIIYLAAFDGDELLGIFLFQRESAATVQGHTAFLPNGYGRAKELTGLAFEWIWNNTGYSRIYAGVPAENAMARRLVEKAGMSRFGVNADAWLKHGILHDVHLYGISKPGVNHG